MDRRGATIIEVLVAIGIIALCVSLLAPATMYARASARRLQCQNNLRQVGMASESFASAHQSYSTKFPAYWKLLGYLGHAPLEQALFTFAERGGALPNLDVAVLICPEDSIASIVNGDYSYHYSDGAFFRVPAASIRGFRSDGRSGGQRT